jgi:DNA helicase-2/ATP-dependent DNA helicase PcrA
MPIPGEDKFLERYNKLNDAQRNAVDIIDGPVLVIAGPGTGKTQVLTMRIANILLKTDVPPDAILALTFTESGVKAMRERLLATIGAPAYYVNIHTFHSFSSSVIQANPDEFIHSSQVEPLSDLERIHIFKEIFDSLDIKSIKPFSSEYYYLQTTISKIKDLKREGIDCDEYLSFINSENFEEKDLVKNIDLHKVYDLYQKKLKQYKRYDFEDMINFAIDRFKTNPDFLRANQERFQYFLVDEFQDTNSAQAELLYLLNSYEEFAESPNLFVVGDDDQSIYRFQGASIENILNFHERYPQSEVVVLRENYRSNQEVVTAATNLIKNNKLRISNKINIDKKQKAQHENASPVITYGCFSSFLSENHYIGAEVKKLIENGTKPSEIAIIYRNNSDSDELKNILTKFDVKYKIVGGEDILNTGLIIRLLHLLRVIYKSREASEDLDLFTLLNYEFLKFNPLDILKLSRFASNKKINLFEALDHSDIENAGLDDLTKLKEFRLKLIEWNHEASNKTFIQFIEDLINNSGFLDWVLSQPENYLLLNKLNSFLSEVKRLNRSDSNINLEKFLKYIDLMYENKIQISEDNISVDYEAVNLLTAHKSKGLEFDYIIIPQFIEKKWSNTISRDLIKLPSNILKSTTELTPDEKKFQQQEDDRRLFFVALTRAKKGIYITSAEKYPSGKDAIASMFLAELNDEEIIKIDCHKYEQENKQIIELLLKQHEITLVHTEQEEAFLKEALHGFKLSASSLNTYLECPYKFKLQFLFRTPKEQTKPLILGIITHKVLEESYKLIKNKQIVTYAFMESVFKQTLADQILNDRDKKSIEEDGLSVLKIYYDTYAENFSKPHYNFYFLEKFFGWGWSKPMLEGTPLQGKVDKIEIIDNNQKLIKITDYKTGNPKSRNEIMGDTKYADGNEYRQLLFYKLLIELDETFKYKVHEVELDFIGNRKNKPKKESFIINDADVENLRKVILDVSRDIRGLKFQRTTKYSVCANCDFKNHCWPDGMPTFNPDEFISEELKTQPNIEVPMAEKKDQSLQLGLSI